VGTGGGHGFECVCCGAGSARPEHLACKDYYLGTPFRADYYRCARCGLVQQSPIPSDVAPFYGNYPVHRPKSSFHDALRRVLLSRVYFRPPPRGRLALLDYGCGDGAFLKQVVRPGLGAVGFEPDAAQAAAVASRTGAHVYSDAGELLARNECRLDVVTMHFVLEHVTDLHATFALVRRLLRPGGVFYFVVPQASSAEARLFGRRWHGLDPPRHVSLPEPPAVAVLAAANGFAVARHEAVPFPNGFAGSIPTALLGRFSFPLMAAALPAGVLFTWFCPTGMRAFTLRATTDPAKRATSRV
jgi:SAM-dependent methyltransferase